MMSIYKYIYCDELGAAACLQCCCRQQHQWQYMHSNSLICCYNLQVITNYLSPHDPSTTDVALGNASLGPLLGAGRLVKVGSAEGMGNLASRPGA